MFLNNCEIKGQNESITIEASQIQWEIVNDNVMGGVSIGDFKIQNSSSKVIKCQNILPIIRLKMLKK